MSAPRETGLQGGRVTPTRRQSAAASARLRLLENTPLESVTPGDLVTCEGVERRLVRVGKRIGALNSAIVLWGQFARTDDERDLVRELEAERAALIDHQAGLKVRRDALDSERNTTYAKAFQRAVKESVPPEEFRRLVARANAIVEEVKARAALQTTGSAVPPVGAVAGMRVRRR